MTFTVRALSGAQLPPRLRDLEEPPSTVYVAGELPRTRAVAIVGTRSPSPEGVEFARRLASELAEHGVTVLSGGATGIDTAAHTGALDARGATVVVAPSSYDHPYPAENADLFARILAEGGAYLSEYEHSVKPARPSFFRRNAFLAALSDALVVVETRFRGGARNAAATARRLGRPVLAVPAAPWTTTGGGCILELKAGARVAASVTDVLEAIGEPLGVPRLESAQGALPFPARRQAPDPGAGLLPPDGHAVVELLSVGPLWPDEICRELGLPAQRVQELLLTLTLDDVVVSEPSGRVALLTVRDY